MLKFILIWVVASSLYGKTGFDYLEKASFKDGGMVEVSCAKASKRWNQIISFNKFQIGDFCVKSTWISSGFFKSKTTKLCYLNADVVYFNGAIKEVQISEISGCSKIAFMAGDYQCSQDKCMSSQGISLEVLSNALRFPLASGNEDFLFETTGKVAVLDKALIKMVYVPSGEFKMGSPKSEKNRNLAEAIVQVKITKPFLLQKYELNQKQWRQINKKEKFGFSACEEVYNGGKICSKYPVSLVRLKSIQDFINALNKLKNPKKDCGNVHSDKGYKKAFTTSGCFRLPTEAEWEYAARAGSQKSFGLPLSINEANATKFMNVKSTTLKPVGSYPYANLWGLYDMHGNVQEFVQDHYKPRYNIGAPQSDPLNFKVSEADAKRARFWKSHVAKGGDYFYGFERARSASRESYYSDSKRLRTGFRLARTL